jgi:hypothetical protein
MRGALEAMFTIVALVSIGAFSIGLGMTLAWEIDRRLHPEAYALSVEMWAVE